ncbi:hypothetical protein BH24CHL3_BH24CHL3_07920 [soil metagenome]
MQGSEKVLNIESFRLTALLASDERLLKRLNPRLTLFQQLLTRPDHIAGRTESTGINLEIDERRKVIAQ